VKLIIMIFSIVFFLCSCSDGGKYQMVTASDGNVYRLDKSSGEIWLVKGNAVQKLPAKDFYLKIGQRYIGEDIYSFAYMGKGIVGDIKTLDNNMIEEKKKK
jgi:hypothetical protein